MQLVAEQHRWIRWRRGMITATVTDPMVVVELRGGGDKCEYLRAPLKDSMLVQDALKGSGAIQRFRRMDIVLVRHCSRRRKTAAAGPLQRSSARAWWTNTTTLCMAEMCWK